ncbi:MAG: PLP-dependent aminotransferase family protein [Actinomycetia bacterium]|nr:PLP-dependent aminotransferase family protein [Actinomycetes bacterium]
MTFDMTALFRPGLPAAGGRWAGYPKYSFVGGHNDGDNVPFGGLSEAAVSVLRREGTTLASYNVGGSPQGYAPLREFVAGTLESRAATPTDPGDVLVVSGSLQALDLVNGILLERGDTVIVEQATYGGMISKLHSRGVEVVGVDLDDDGISSSHLAELLAHLAGRGVRPKYIYTIPTVQNPTGSVMPVERRLEILAVARQYGVPIFEDDCYADLVFDGSRPPTFRALDDGGGLVIYCGSFSKSIAPALRVGYVVADWPVLSQMIALKTDAGTGALEQMVLAEYASSHFDDHVRQLASVLEGKCHTMTDAVTGSFGDSASFTMPKGGIFVWLTFPEGVDTGRLAGPARKAGVEFNPGAGWSADPEWGKRRLRLCFGHPSPEIINEGVGVLADVFRREGAI